MKFSGRNLYFTNEEVDSMRRFGSTGLKIIAFKPLDCLKQKYHTRASQFLYADDITMKGSTKLFVALYKKCVEKQVCALCQYIPRENIVPKFVALVPSVERMDEVGTQIQPPGFSVLFLPFADDFRSNLPLYRDAPKADKTTVASAGVSNQLQIVVSFLILE